MNVATGVNMPTIPSKFMHGRLIAALVSAGAGHLPAQAVAIVLATPFSFAANKLWAFAESPAGRELAPIAVKARQSER